MSLLDLIIAYLACGMPFAVYRIALSGSTATETATRSIRAGLLWPFDGGKAVIKRLRTASRSLSKPRIEVTRSEMEELLAQDIPHFGRFQFREVFDRYSGLALALHTPDRSPAGGLFLITGADMTPTGEACLRRTAKVRIERHAASARRELIEYLIAAASPRVFELAATLATELSDPSLSKTISRRYRQTQKIPSTSVVPLSGSAS